ncbi:hypothetical protein [Acaryochloris sp. 'Moss Beach']|nr:hypothetical protein [Acaryochloris sp. 'Moss Beach']
MSHLIDTLKQVPDFRSAHGRIHPLWLLLLLMVMFSGRWSTLNP